MSSPAFHATTPTANATGGTYVVTLPTYSTGDVVLIHLDGYHSGNPIAEGDISPPSGWTILKSSAIKSADKRTWIIARVIDGTEGAPSTITMTINNHGTSMRCRANSTSYSGVYTAAAYTGTPVATGSSSPTSSFAGGNITTQTVDTTVLLFITAYNDFTATTNIAASTGGVTERYDNFNFIWNQALEELPESTAGTYSISGSINVQSSYYDTITIALTSVAAGLEDSATISSKTTLSATEVRESADSLIIPSTTTPSLADVTEFIETATIAGTTSTDWQEIYTGSGTEYTDSGTISSVTTPSISDTAEFTESATIPGISGLTYQELRESYDADTFGSTTAVSWSEHFCHVNPKFSVEVTARWQATVGEDQRWSVVTNDLWSSTLYAYSVVLEPARWAVTIKEEALLNVC